MSSFSIDIFSDTEQTTSLDSSATLNTPTTDPLMNFRPQSTSLNAPELLPLHNNPDNRFEQNRLLNGKTKYEETNTIIQSLEEEIVSMKHKLSFVYEKDEEIGKLKETVNELKKQVTDLESSTQELVKMRLENNQLQTELMELKHTRLELEKLSSENKLLREKLKSIDSDESKQVIDDIQDIEELSITDEIEEIDEMINVNIHQLRQVLLNRLKDKQISHIESLINTYGLKRKNQVKRSVMERMLEEAIHL